MALAPLRLLSKNKKTVAGSSTVNLDTVPNLCFRQLEYTIHYYNEIQNKYYSLKILLHRTDNDVDNTQYALFGDCIDAIVTPQISGSQLQLQLVNNETYDIVSSFTRKILN